MYRTTLLFLFLVPFWLNPLWACDQPFVNFQMGLSICQDTSWTLNLHGDVITIKNA